MWRRHEEAEPRWDGIFQYVLADLARQEFEVPKWDVPHPLDAGFSSASGNPQGALEQYSVRLSDGGRIHIREYPTYYRLHWDEGDPDSGLNGLVTHFIRDAPEVLVLSALAGIIIATLSKRAS